MGNKVGLNKEKIIDAAFDYADEKGIETLSMRTIADILGVKAMSLYNHVKNKEEIIDGIVDKVISKIYLPDPEENWKVALKKRSLSTYESLLAHQWALFPLVSRMNLGSANLIRQEKNLACLKNAGFSLSEADHAIHTIDSYTFGFALIIVNFPIPSDAYAETSNDYKSLLNQSVYPTMYELTQLVINREYDGFQELGYGLEMLLDGLDHKLAYNKQQQ